jgi:nucleotide-binding universal stress UspA family protein
VGYPAGEDFGMAGRIVVGVDGTEESAAALRWALEEAGLRDAKVEAVHAWSYAPVATPADAGLVPLAWTESSEAVDATREAAERVAGKQVREIAGDNSRVAVSVVAGDAADVLIDAAEGADLLVVGNRGRGAFAQALFGSTSARVSDKAQCPVVVVHRGDTA